MSAYIEYSKGQIIGNSGLKYISDAKKVGKHRMANFLCHCGNEFKARIDSVKSGQQQGCGCVQIKRAREANQTHGDYEAPLYKAYNAMKARCNNENNPNYFRYGGRGIKVCDEWASYEPFKKWAISNGHKKGLTLDRKDNNDGYSPENCRWVTHRENMRNRSNSIIWNTPEGEFKTLADASSHYGKDLTRYFYPGKDGFKRVKKYAYD